MSDENSRLLRGVRNAVINEARKLPIQQPMRPANLSYQNKDIDRSMWYGWSPEAQRVDVTYQEEDDQLFITPVNEPEPDSDDRYEPVWVTGNCPPWNCPNFWGYPFDQDFTACINEYEVDTLVGTLTSPEMAMSVLRGISYEVSSGLLQREVFEITIKLGSQVRVRIEDMIIDPSAAAPAQRYVFAGDTRPLDIRDFGDRNKDLNVFVRARGIVDFDGNSNKQPGDPITNSANVRVSLMGWGSTLRDNDDGGPRPTDLGNMMNIPMADRIAMEGVSDDPRTIY